MTRYQEAVYDLAALYAPKMLYDLGRPDIVDELSDYSLDYDEYGEFIMNATNLVFDSVENNGYDAENLGDYHISIYRDPAMKDFYKLVRRYSSRNHIPLKKNPYLLEAKTLVDQYLNLDSSSSGYELRTKSKDCGIVFYCNCFFDSQEELLEGLIQILNFFRKEAAVLRKELGIIPVSHAAPPASKAA